MAALRWAAAAKARAKEKAREGNESVGSERASAGQVKVCRGLTSQAIGVERPPRGDQTLAPVGHWCLAE